jgi:hypothetical protein
MHHALKTICDKYKTDLQSFQDQVYNFAERDIVYSDNKFSELFKVGLWQDNMLRSQYLNSLDTQLMHRGFIVEREGPEVDDADDNQHKINKQRWNDADNTNKQVGKKAFREWLDGGDNPKFIDTLAIIKNIPYSNIKGQQEVLKNYHIQLNDIIRNDRTKYKIYENIFLYPKTLQNNCNLISSIYTKDRLRQISANHIHNDFLVMNLDTINTKVLLLHDMIEFVNQYLPKETRKLEVFNMTLHQKQYKEDLVVYIKESTWDHFKFITKTAKNKPKTLKDCVRCVYMLSKKIFGKWFSDERKTKRFVISKKTKKKTMIVCYNYVTDESLLNCFIDMAYWGDKDVNDFHPDIVIKYKIRERIERDIQAIHLNTAPSVPNVVKDAHAFKVDLKDIFQ